MIGSAVWTIYHGSPRVYPKFLLDSAGLIIVVLRVGGPITLVAPADVLDPGPVHLHKGFDL